MEQIQEIQSRVRVEGRNIDHGRVGKSTRKGQKDVNIDVLITLIKRKKGWYDIRVVTPVHVSIVLQKEKN